MDATEITRAALRYYASALDLGHLENQGVTSNEVNTLADGFEMARRVVVEVSGGMVTAIAIEGGGEDVRIVVVDYDCDGDREYSEITGQGPANIYAEETTLNPVLVAEAFQKAEE